jgi:Rad3-related DNA helicase
VNLLNFFPEGYEPTTSQSKTIDQIQTGFESSDVVILSAPTGSGKSFFANTIANSARKISKEKQEAIYSYDAFALDQHGDYQHHEPYPGHGALALTITKTLQDQYAKLFDCTILKGKSNYISTIDSQMDVEIESAVMPKKLLHAHRVNHECPYHNDRRDLLIDHFGSTNYKMFMNLPDHVKQRDYIICDEASELEEEIVSQYSCTIDYESLERVGIKTNKLKTDDHQSAYIWLDDLAQSLQEQKIYLQKNLQKKSSWSPRMQTRYKIINNIHSHVSICLTCWDSCEYVIEKSMYQASFTPLYVNELAQSVLSHGNKVLLMSATIIDHKSYAKSLGISNYTYIESESDFDPKRSPIYISKKYPLSRQTINTYLPRIINNIKSLLSHHPDVKGVIHTHTHDITQRVCDTLNDPRLLYREPGVSNEDILDQHNKSTEPTVLVSPSLTYGIDLKDDLARFQIVVKLPYLPLQNKRIKQLFEKDSEWYENKMLNTFVQSCGRATRGIDDHSCTYVLDGNVAKVLHRCKHKLPDHFIRRFA